MLGNLMGRENSDSNPFKDIMKKVLKKNQLHVKGENNSQINELEISLLNQANPIRNCVYDIEKDLSKAFSLLENIPEVYLQRKTTGNCLYLKSISHYVYPFSEIKDYNQENTLLNCIELCPFPRYSQGPHFSTLTFTSPSLRETEQHISSVKIERKNSCECGCYDRDPWVISICLEKRSQIIGYIIKDNQTYGSKFHVLDKH